MKTDKLYPDRDRKTFRAVLKDGERILRENGVEEYRTDAWILFSNVTGLDRTALLLHGEEDMPDEGKKRFLEMLARRIAHEPVQYITGEAWFYGYSFLVTPDVLIPRQDTEVLVEETLRLAASGNRILDLCTGSGCILLSVLKEMEKAGMKGTGIGTDISSGALAVAGENAKRMGVSTEFLQSDLFREVTGTFDLITANPPYIRSGEIGELAPEVREMEPLQALDGGEDGLSFYRRIIREASAFLKHGGALVMEIGYDEGKDVSEMLAADQYCDILIRKDLSGLDRVALGKRRD